MNAAAVLAVAPPFDLLPKRVRTTLIAASQERRFEAGELILDAFRTTPEQVGVLLAGAVELWVEGERAEAQSAPVGRMDKRATCCHRNRPVIQPALCQAE